jgi:lysozyme
MIGTDPRLREQMILHEGRRARTYADSRGILTAGIGRNLMSVSFADDEIELMFSNDVVRTIVALNEHLPWWTALDPIRARVFFDMAFNLGIVGLLSFHRLLDAAKRQDWPTVVDEMKHSRWALQVGDGPGGKFDRADRLEMMMFTGRDFVA